MFTDYKNGVRILSPDPDGDAALEINNDLKAIADFLDTVSLIGHTHDGADIVSGTISDDFLSSAAQNAIAATHSPLTLGTASGLSLSAQALSLALATTGTAGAMSSADKAKLNGIDLSQYLTLSGATMEGDVDLNGHDLNNANGIYGSYLGSPDTTTNLEMTSDGMIAHVSLSMNGNTLDMGDGNLQTKTLSDIFGNAIGIFPGTNGQNGTVVASGNILFNVDITNPTGDKIVLDTTGNSYSTLDLGSVDNNDGGQLIGVGLISDGGSNVVYGFSGGMVYVNQPQTLYNNDIYAVGNIWNSFDTTSGKIGWDSNQNPQLIGQNGQNWFGFDSGDTTSIVSKNSTGGTRNVFDDGGGNAYFDGNPKWLRMKLDVSTNHQAKVGVVAVVFPQLGAVVLERKRNHCGKTCYVDEPSVVDDVRVNRYEIGNGSQIGEDVEASAGSMTKPVPKNAHLVMFNLESSSTFFSDGVRRFELKEHRSAAKAGHCIESESLFL